MNSLGKGMSYGSTQRFVSESDDDSPHKNASNAVPTQVMDEAQPLRMYHLLTYRHTPIFHDRISTYSFYREPTDFTYDIQ